MQKEDRIFNLNFDAYEPHGSMVMKYLKTQVQNCRLIDFHVRAASIETKEKILNNTLFVFFLYKGKNSNFLYRWPDKL